MTLMLPRRLLQSPGPAAAPTAAEEATSLLLDATERLLDAHAAALAAVAGARSGVRAQLQGEYEAQRQELLQAALGEAVRLRDAGECCLRQLAEVPSIC